MSTHTRAGTRVLGCFKQAVLILRWLLDGTRVKQLARDNAISESTAYDYIHEGIDVLAAQAPTLHGAPGFQNRFDLVNRGGKSLWRYVALRLAPPLGEVSPGGQGVGVVGTQHPPHSGFWGPPLRIFAPSEITLVALRTT